MSRHPELAFDVTVMLTAPMSGIPRVMHTVARALLEEPTSEVRFCCFDPERQVFAEVPAERVRKIVGDSAVTRHRNWSAATPARAHGTGHRTSRLVGARPTLAGRPATRRVLLRGGSYLRRTLAELAAVPGAVRADRHRIVGPCDSDTWTEDTVYCSLGLDRYHGQSERIASQRARRGFRTLLTVYDLIPIVAPQYVVPVSNHPLEPHGLLGYADHFALVVGGADHLFVISEATRRDVEAFATSLGLTGPPTTMLPMGSTVPRGPGVRPRSLAAGVGTGGFVLSVGTVEIRKNLRLLLDVWEMLLRDRPRSAVPDLVIVGKRGWLFDETYARLTRTPAFAGVVHHVEDASDDELAWCYANALVTCVPSLYEGWGLPVSESLAAGTPCLSADVAGLPEAGQGCTDLLDPFDRIAWRDRIVELVDDPTARRRRADRIRDRYVGVDPDATARTVLATVHQLREDR